MKRSDFIKSIGLLTAGGILIPNTTANAQITDNTYEHQLSKINSDLTKIVVSL